MKTDSTCARDLIALSLMPGAGRGVVHTALRAASRRGTVLGGLFGLPKSDLLAAAAPGETSIVGPIHACGEAERARAAWLLGLAAQQGHGYITCLDSGYPSFLAGALAAQAPPLLFFQGNEALLEGQGGGVVGTRRPTEEGREWARAAARLFAGEGITLMSGGADGIDLEAHRAALMAEGTTVVILPAGLHAHQPHPAIRRGLENGQVLLLSEFLPTDDWQTHRAMTRNRTIAAFSRTLCVVEPREKGGSMYTAEQALDQGTPVFYWGGACRDGALRGRHGAYPLVRSGTLAAGGVRAAVLRSGPDRARQGELFDE